ncbi:protein ABIL2-like [Bidens hawaiensis]|uniref:protein ABIL2-like n=1 Tax=Bidens hawaiensis TaxID=980011 RepID=UPI004048EBCD
MEPVKDLHLPSNYDEIFMQRSLIFADNLQDLRNVRSQLYKAAEFFEDTYHKTNHDPLLLESLKDYVSKALISTIDHLGSVTSKVNSFLDENIDEAFETNFRVLCIKQRMQTCQTFSHHEGLSQQSLVIHTPKYHKQYLLPDGQFSEGVEAVKTKAESLSLRRGRDVKESGPDLVDFTFAKVTPNKGLEKRSQSLSPSRFRIKRSGSVSNPSVSPISRVGHFGSVSPFSQVRHSESVLYRSVSPDTQHYQPEARRSYSMYSEKERRKDIQLYSKKTRNLFKAFLSIQKNKSER